MLAGLMVTVLLGAGTITEGSAILPLEAVLQNDFY
jgi:hypothetical protein